MSSKSNFDTLEMLALAVAGEMTRAGLAAPEADTCALNAVHAVCRLVGGGEVYLPTTYRADRAARTARMLADWRAGATYNEIAERYGVTERRVRQVTACARRSASTPHPEGTTT